MKNIIPLIFFFLTLTNAYLKAQETKIDSSFAVLEVSGIDKPTQFANETIIEDLGFESEELEDFGYQIDRAIRAQDATALAIYAQNLLQFEQLSDTTSSVVTANQLAHRAMNYFLETVPTTKELALFIHLDETFKLGNKQLLLSTRKELENGQSQGFGEWDGTGKIKFINNSDFPIQLYIDGIKDILVKANITQYISVNAGCGTLKAKWGDGSFQQYSACVREDSICNCTVK